MAGLDPSFRAHVSAATLKPKRPQTAQRSTSSFRAHVSAATLKPKRPQTAQRSTSCFRAHVSAATLKLDWLSEGRVSRAALPCSASPSLREGTIQIEAAIDHRASESCSSIDPDRWKVFAYRGRRSSCSLCDEGDLHS